VSASRPFPVPDIPDVRDPDVSWIKKFVPIKRVALELGFRIRQNRAKCWRIENHRHGDVDPSLRFHEKKNRVRCFVCDSRGGHSNIDLVMAVLSVDFRAAVRWIAEKFTVASVKRGRPVGRSDRAVSPPPFRVGTHNSDFDVLVRSGMFGELPSAERSILVTLDVFRDSDSGVTRLSYSGIMRYAGVSKRANVSRALAQLQKLHAIQISRGARIGIVRESSVYRVTLDDAKFLEHCDEIYQRDRQEIERDRQFRRELRLERQRSGRTPRTPAGGPAPRTPRMFLSNLDSNSQATPSKKPPCTGQHLSSLREPQAIKAVPRGNRENADSREGRILELRRQAAAIIAKYSEGRNVD